jgi:uncharacterized protein
MHELEIRREGDRFIGQLNGEDVAFAEVDDIASDGLLIKHTEVLPAFEGRGLAGALMRHVLEDAKRHGRNVVPTCPYAAAYIERHPEYHHCLRKG